MLHVRVEEEVDDASFESDKATKTWTADEDRSLGDTTVSANAPVPHPEAPDLSDITGHSIECARGPDVSSYGEVSHVPGGRRWMKNRKIAGLYFLGMCLLLGFGAMKIYTWTASALFSEDAPSAEQETIELNTEE